MNLEKLRKMYNENPILKEAFEDAFSSDELNNTPIVYQCEFNIAFNKILEGSTQIYLNTERHKVSTEKTSRIEVLNSKGMWLLEYDTDPENSYFFYQYDRVYLILQDIFCCTDEQLDSLMKTLVETQFNIKDATPVCRK